MIEDLIRHLRKDAEGHRVTFKNTDPPGGKNAELFDRWADEVESLRSRVAEMEGALHDILTGVSLDWYVKEFSYHNREGGDSSGIISTIHNFETRNRVAAAFERGRQALASSGKGNK